MGASKPEPEYKWICTSRNPWDFETLPVLHKEAAFEDWPLENWLTCPACGHTWTIGPDTI